MNRIQVIDSLRGFALLTIMLVHSANHFNAPEVEKSLFYEGILNGYFKELMDLLIVGKSYLIFSLLFGLGFYLQIRRKLEKNQGYYSFFLKRLFVLGLIGFFLGLFYNGEILLFYSLFGIVLLPLSRLSTRINLLVAIFLIFQIPTWLFSEFDISLMPIGKEDQSMFVYGDQGTFKDLMEYNLWEGRLLTWTYYFRVGRHYQMVGFFILGMLLSRIEFFQRIDKFGKILNWSAGSTLIFGLLFYLLNKIFIFDQNLTIYIRSIESAFLAIGITCAFISSFLKFKSAFIFRALAHYGKNSLTNYFTQCIIGVVLFYGFGFGLYKSLGIILSSFLGLLVFVIQVGISQFWNERFLNGPLEWFWRATTSLDYTIPFRIK